MKPLPGRNCGTVNSKAYDNTFRFLKQDFVQILPNTILLIFFCFSYSIAELAQKRN